MLKISDIHKKYITGDLVQTALDGVTLTLRDNEFVAILGPSGSGKTTLLNVIGGLDRYDSGDLIINGISTQKYSDRDWDSYRNHTVGFVFQSYNLIPHQTVLSNVELALTISGISRSERRKRAIQALTDVGLGDQIHKRPNQMSGGQMQRVAIARALVNNPDILLADEPTGALDSETSVQVMDLLKEVSRDRLVVMVTHNPELAEQYANRIVRVRDGRIIDDTNPCVLDEEDIQPPKHKNMGRASMSFLTALSLSFNNLKTKKGRTILTSFAGSIGIIGIALILSLSTGFQMYVDQIQEDTLSNYPLSIQTETTDMAAMMSAFGSVMTAGKDAEDGTVVEQQLLTQMFAQVNTNDLGAFKSYYEENEDAVEPYVNYVKYSYGIKPRIYSAEIHDGPVQVNPGELFGQLTGMSQMSAMMDSDVFYELLDNQEMLEAQYDVAVGKWPESKEEMVVVLNSPNQISDYMAYTLGLKSTDSLFSLMEQIAKGEEPEFHEEPEQWTYEDIMALEYRLLSVPELYRYNEQYQVWEDMSDSNSFMISKISKGLPLKIVGIIIPKEDSSTTLLGDGVAYTKDLTKYVIDQAAKSKIVNDQIQNPDVNVFTGKDFGETEERQGLNFEDMISVDGEMIASAFGMNVSTSGIIDMVKSYLKDAYSSIEVDNTAAKEDFVNTLGVLATDMLTDYIGNNADEQGSATIKLEQIPSVVENYLSSSGAQSAMQVLESKYQLTDGMMRQTYCPLLTAMLTGYVATESVLPQLPSVPDSSAQPEGNPEDTTEPPSEETPDADIPVQPDVSVDEELPADLPDSGEIVLASQTQEMLLTGDSGEGADNEQVNDQIEEGSDTPTVTEPTEPENDDTTSQEPSDNDSVVLDPIYAVISVADVDVVVSNFLATESVAQAADVVSVAMMSATVKTILVQKVQNLLPTIMSYVGSGFYVDEEKLTSAFQFNMNEEDLRRLMTAMSGTSEKVTYDSNLRSLGYADLDEPTSISIYFVDFAGKSEFLTFLDDYNAQMEELGLEDSMISYTDITSIMMSSVRTIIDSVSYVLIAFVAVSLVVSSIMIGIITYISVMERTKEIGILRAIGASKNNISQVFNAETFIIGLCSGLIGVVTTVVLNIPVNYIIHRLTENTSINAKLPMMGAIILVILSMVLTLIGGLIPSRQAAKKDPVIALRSE